MSSFTYKEVEALRRAFELGGVAAMAAIRGQSELSGVINRHDKATLHEVLASFRDALANLHLAYHDLLAVNDSPEYLQKGGGELRAARSDKQPQHIIKALGDQALGAFVNQGFKT